MKNTHSLFILFLFVFIILLQVHNTQSQNVEAINSTIRTYLPGGDFCSSIQYYQFYQYYKYSTPVTDWSVTNDNLHPGDLTLQPSGGSDIYQTLTMTVRNVDLYSNGGKYNLELIARTSGIIQPIYSHIVSIQCALFQGPIVILNQPSKYKPIYTTSRMAEIITIVQFNNTPIDSMRCSIVGFACNIVPFWDQYLENGHRSVGILNLVPRLDGSLIKWSQNATLVLNDPLRPIVPSQSITLDFTSQLYDLLNSQPQQGLGSIQYGQKESGLNVSYPNPYISMYVEVLDMDTPLFLQSKFQRLDLVPIQGNELDAVFVAPMPININEEPYQQFQLYQLQLSAPTEVVQLPPLKVKYQTSFDFTLPPPINPPIVLTNNTTGSIETYTCLRMVTWESNTTLTTSVMPALSLLIGNYTMAVQSKQPFGLASLPSFVDGLDQGVKVKFSIPYSCITEYKILKTYQQHNLTLGDPVIVFSGSLRNSTLKLYDFNIYTINSNRFLISYGLQSTSGYAGLLLYLNPKKPYEPSYYLPQTDFVSGNATYQAYQHEVNISMVYGSGFKLRFLEYTGYSLDLSSSDLIPGSNLSYIPSRFPTFQFNISDIDYFQWVPSIVDVSTSDQVSTLYFNFSTSNNINDVDSTPGLIINRFGNLFKSMGSLNFEKYSTSLDDIQFGAFDPDSNCFKINVTIKQGTFPGHLYYSLPVDPQQVTSEMIATVIGKQSTYLSVKCQYADMMGPMVKDIKSFGVISPSSSSGSFITWFINITDINGLYNDSRYSYAGASSDLYPSVPIYLPLQFVEGDAYNGYYKVELQVSSDMISQRFKLDLYLTDYLFNPSSSFNDYHGENITIDPFITTGQQDYRWASLDNTPSTVDNTGPQIISLTTTPPSPVNLDVSSPDRMITFDIIATDMESNINLLYLPVLYLTAHNGQQLSKEMKINSTSGPHFYYQATFELPYGFGIGAPVLISIYGLMNNQMQTRGYSSEDLLGNSMIYSIQTVISMSPAPILLSASPVTRDGGMITIQAKNIPFVLSSPDCTITYDVITDYIVPKLIQPVLVILNLPPFTNNITVQCNDMLMINTNELVIYPYEPLVITPPPHPPVSPPPIISGCLIGTNSSSKGQTICSGHGSCVNNQCVCTNGTYWGPLCDGILPPNGTNTQTGPNNPTTSTNNIHSTLLGTINIVSVQEMDISYNAVKTYPLASSWLIKQQISTPTIDTVQYTKTYRNDSGGVSNILVEIQLFKTSQNITFANQTSTMKSGSIKYSISLSKYKFATQLNTLRVVMNIGMESIGETDTCLLFQQISGTGGQFLQWIKIQVNGDVMYGRFLQVGYVDDRVATVSNRLLSTDKENGKLLVGIDIPHFNYYVNIDPDFGMLVADEDAKGSPDSYCKDNSKTSKTISQTGKIIGIVVGCTVFAIILMVVLYRKFKYPLRIYFADRKNANQKFDVELSQEKLK